MANDNTAAGVSNELSLAMSTTLVALANSLTLQNAIAGLSVYDGSNIPLKDFLQDVRNGDASITRCSEQGTCEQCQGSCEEQRKTARMGNHLLR